MILSGTHESETGARPLYLIAEPRSGSSWLMHTLDSHPLVRLRGELLNPEAFPAAKRFENMAPEMHAECLAYLEETAENESLAWTGCKLLLPHLLRTGDDFVEKLLRRIPAQNGRIIFLSRENMLAARISQELAFKTGKWHVSRPGQRHNATLEPDPEAFWWKMDFAWKWRGKIVKHLDESGVPSLRLTYEELFAHPRRQLKRIASFLEISVRGFSRCREVRTNPRPPHRVLSNYAAVARRLRRDSRFATMLPEADRREENSR